MASTPMVDDQVAPVDLECLTSTETQQYQQQQQKPEQQLQQQYTSSSKLGLLADNHVRPLDPSNEKIHGSELEQHKQLQQQQPQQDQQQPVEEFKTEQDSFEKQNALVDTPQVVQQQQQGPVVTSAGKFKLAGLVDRVRLAQQQDQLQTLRPPPAEAYREQQGGHHHRHLGLGLLSSHDSSNSDNAANGSRPPSSIIHNVIETDEHKHHHHLHHHSTPRSGPAVHFPKIFSKDGVKNALFMTSAATAFTKSTRSRTMEAVQTSMANLVVTGSMVPALYLRRDDKGRRPPPVLFQMLKIAVTDSEIDLGVSKQIIFRMELQYGDVKWVIRRTVYEFYKLHLTLAAKRFDNLPKFPSQVSYAFSMAKASLGMKNEDKVNYLRQTNLARRQALQSYMIQVLNQLNWTVAYDLYEFLEISALSLTKDMGWKGKEAYVDTKVTDMVHSCCGMGRLSRWDKNWAILRDSYMAFLPSIGTDDPTDVFLFDQNFYVEHKEHALGLNMHHIQFGDRHRTIEIKGDHNREMLEWMEHFQKMQQSSPWVRSHRFGSFAPERNDAKVRYYVDGKDYFHAVSDAILAAKSEIYICDWWLSPELYLRRPPEKNEEFRLDRLLKKKAMEGVMIYIVVYKEVSLALTLDSAHTKIWLQKLHPNIQVQRHPDHISVNATQFWAHHEKICVVDCRLAFIGGLDMCFGRYDSRTHQLADYHPSGKGTIWPGQDYSNPRIKDFTNVKDYNNDLIEKKLLARMPWHDVSVGVAGQPARDIARHFVQRWNFVKREKGMKKTNMKFLTPKGEFVSTRNESGWTGTQKVQILRSSTLWSQGVDMERSIQDAYLTSITNAEHFIYIENQFFVTLGTENGNPDIKNKIGIALVDRILRAHQEGQKFRVVVVMPLMPAFEADIMSSEAGTLRKVMHFQYVSICRGGNSVLERLIANGVDPDQYIGFFGLRSFDRIKHGKFDAIVEAVKEEEERNRRKQGRSGAGQGGLAEDQSSAPESEQEGTNTNNVHDTRNVDGEEGISRGRSLVSKFLLEPIPKDEEAERIKAVADQRKLTDGLRTWDESITKKAMNPAMKEHGYIPAATEQSLADTELNQEIQKDTTEAEIEAGHNQHRGPAPGESSPKLIEGLGTMVRTAIEMVKGNKDQGDLEPMHHKITRNPHLQNLRHHHRDADEDSVQIEIKQQDTKSKEDQAAVTGGGGLISGGVLGSSGHARTSAEEERRSVKEDTEAIIEPYPGGTDSNDTPKQAEGGRDGKTDPSEFPHVDTVQPQKIERPIVDDELENFVTEQLYIHSKLMIVDDRIIICGSANINDRSQVGFRDSEIAIIIEDTDIIDTRMNGQPYKAGRLPHTLRADLFKEHLGLLPHVEHDVVTKASVLPVDLDAPHIDPEVARQELIQKALLQDQQQQQQQQSSDATQQPLEIRPCTHEEPRKNNTHCKDCYGYVQVYQPNEEEAEAYLQWQQSAASSTTATSATQPEIEANAHNHHHHEAKKATAEDPSRADEIVMDPLHDDFYEGWWKRVAATNTAIFREVFRCVPDNSVETWDDYRAFVPNPKKVLTGHVAMRIAVKTVGEDGEMISIEKDQPPTLEMVTERLQKVTGHLVEFPTKFLMKENLLSGGVGEAVMPMEIFT